VRGTGIQNSYIMKKLLTILILLFTTTAYAQVYTVERVIDGGTLKLTNGERVCLIGIDTPETHESKKLHRNAERTGQDVETIKELGKQSTEFVKSLLPVGTEVQLEYDVEKKDKYGRLLAYVYLPIRLGKKYPTLEHRHRFLIGIGSDAVACLLINSIIISEGYASPMTIPPNVKHAELFEKLYQEARENKIGVTQNVVDSSF